MPRSRYHVLNEQSPHFMTATVNHWLPLFTRPATVEIVLDSWRYLQREAGFTLYGYVILENHLHLVAASEHLSRDMQRFKSYTAKEIIAHLQQHGSPKMLELLALFKRQHKTESTYQVWEEGSLPSLSKARRCCGRSWTTSTKTRSSAAMWTGRNTGAIPVRGIMRGWTG